MLLELPGPFDASVCQTSSVVNLYAALSLSLNMSPGTRKGGRLVVLCCENGDAYLSGVAPA